MSILDLTALELGKKIKAGEITSLQATEAVIKQKILCQLIQQRLF